MIGTIRKHSNWLWYPIIVATIITFVLWGASQALFGNRSTGNFGSVYGKKVTGDQYLQAKKDFILSYWFHSGGKWPDDTTVSTTEMDQQIYLSLMLEQKAEQLGIHVSEDTLAQAAAERLQALGGKQTVSLDALVDQALAPKGFTAADFETFVRNDLTIQELIQSLGLAGKLITPQEAAAAYLRENEELSTRAVFFNASNYVGYVKATPQALGQFYTNFQAEYRLPDRVQISYVVFAGTNYLVQSKAEWAKTNLSDFVDNYFHKFGETYKGSTNADQARAKITEELIESRAVGDARKEANDLATAVFAIDPAKPENLALVAKQKGLIVHETAPFAKNSGPDEFDGSGDFTKAAFDLTPDSPLAGPVTDGDSTYVMALTRTLPSEIPPYNQIRAQVAMDYRSRVSLRMAQQAGTAFAQMLTNQMVAGHSFASICVANGHPAEILPPFSISTEELPELGERVSLNEIKQVAFTTPIGKLSGFEPTRDGGFILLIQSKLAPDQVKMAADMPQFTQNLRRTRQNEAFNEWIQSEASTGLQMPPTASK
jgi:hypothetical protein